MKQSLLSFTFIMMLATPAFSQLGRNTSFPHSNEQTVTNSAFRANHSAINYFAGRPVESNKHNVSALRTPFDPLSTDVIITNIPATNFRNVKIAAAFNGWLFAAYSMNDATGGGLGAAKSTDGGLTWTPFFGVTSAGIDYPSLDLVVAGNTVGTISFYIAGILNNGGSYSAWVDKFNGNTGAFMGENFNEGSANTMYDIALATDYVNPSFVSTGYSVAVIYTRTSAPADSLIYAVSVDSGTTYINRQAAFATLAYLRKADIAYGYSPNRNNGRYFVAFESRVLSTDDIGNVGFIYTSSDPTTTFTTAIYPDSADAGMRGLMRYPNIACENDNVNADSGQVVSMITVDRKYSSTDWDALSLISPISVNATLSNWHRLDIDNTVNTDVEGDVTFSTANSMFEVTYYDSSLAKLLLVKTGLNLTSASAWTIVTSQYNDVTTNLAAPKPQIVVSANDSAANLAWNAEGISAHGVPMFDKEVVTVSVHDLAGASGFDKPFPDPANDEVNFNFDLREQKNVKLEIYNMLGENISTLDMGTIAAGEHRTLVDVSSMEAGIYFYRYTAGKQLVSGKFTVTH
ncbi:MAG: T9SS type A sorting domain-containing protein [Bacteroidetes bacterium]|nr:T9SS type A sorting domain-containing protein [Bacteroidota bacterium]